MYALTRALKQTLAVAHHKELFIRLDLWINIISLYFIIVKYWI